jgi:hypothetical protein
MESRSRLSSPVILLTGLLGGLSLGIVARLWMRWISTDPEFTWSGTGFIIGAFTISMFTQSIVLVLRRRTLSRRKLRVVRAGGVIFTLPMFTAAGGIMFPTVALASIALWTGIFKKRGRIVLLALSLIFPILISRDIVRDFGWTFSTLGRILLFVAIYGLVILATRPTFSPSFESVKNRKPLSAKMKALLFAGIFVIVIVFMLLTFGVPGT